MKLRGQPLAIDLFCGLGGWTEGLLAEGYFVVGFDIEQQIYGEHRYPGHLIIQDVLTLQGSQLKGAALIVASPPCQFFSYCAMPWARAKRLAAEVRADPARLEKELALFNACFRIQREACEATGRHIPTVVENVRGAQPWVGRARWSFGSFYLWGDVPALMPAALGRKNDGGFWFAVAHNSTSGHSQNPDGRKLPGFRFDGSGKSFQSAAVAAEGRKGTGSGSGAEWFDANLCKLPSASPRRKQASAMIAKIPLVLARHIGRAWLPHAEAMAEAR